MSISQRVKALAELEDSKAKFAQKIGITPAGLSDMIKRIPACDHPRSWLFLSYTIIRS
jgi:hypothetical protein